MPFRWTGLCALIMVVMSGLAPLSAQRADTLSTADPVKGGRLPLTELRGTGIPKGVLAIILSGDGGWAELVKSVSTELSQSGINVVGLNSRIYLGTEKTPDELAKDISSVLKTYLQQWKDTTVIVIGYSRGADMIPFLIPRLPHAQRNQIVAVALLGLATTANFKFYLSDLVRNVSRPSDLPVKPELSKLAGVRILCVYGSQEKDSGCKYFDSRYATIIEKPGGHHFDRDYKALAQLILALIPHQVRSKE